MRGRVRHSGWSVHRTSFSDSVTLGVEGTEIVVRLDCTKDPDGVSNLLNYSPHLVNRVLSKEQSMFVCSSMGRGTLVPEI